MRTRIALASFASLACAASSARADLRDDAERIEGGWKRAGASVGRAETRFVYDDETISLAIPPHAEAGVCTAVAVLGARGLSFRARIAGIPEDPLAEGEGLRAMSIAGALVLERCDGPIQKVIVTSEAGRGALEAGNGVSKPSLPPLRSVLPERAGTPGPPPTEPGSLPLLPPPEKRRDVAEARARRDGATAQERADALAGGDGSGELPVRLTAACHRIELFAPDRRSSATGRRRRLDLDAELHDDDDLLLARDRSEAPDARLELCVGEPYAATVAFGGAPPDATVIATHALWPIPAALPDTWGPDTRARMAFALWNRHVPELPSRPVQLAQGVSGTTSVPVPVEVGGCYVAVAAVSRGQARGLGMRAVVGARESYDERDRGDDAGVVAFCARSKEPVRIEVEARGSQVAWGLSVHRIRSGVWGDGS